MENENRIFVKNTVEWAKARLGSMCPLNGF